MKNLSLNTPHSQQHSRRMTMLSLLLVMLLSLSATLSGKPLFAADKVPSESLLPPQVYAYFSFPNVDAMKAAFNNSSSGALLTDEAFAEFRGEIEAKLKEVSDKMRERAGLSLEEVAKIPSGGVVIAFLQSTDGTPSFVTILDYGESRGTVDKILVRLNDNLKDKGATASEEELDGVKIQIFEMKKDVDDEDNDENDAEDGKAKDRLAYVIKDTSVIMGSNPNILKDVLARWDGQHESTFASNDIYKYIMAQCVPEGTTSQFKWFVDPLASVRGTIAASGAMNQQVGMAMAFLPMLGVTKLKAVGGSFEIGGEKYESAHRALMYVDLPAEGVLQMFECPATAQAPPKWVKANAVNYVGINWDADNAYNAIRTMVDNFQGPGTLDRLLDQKGNNKARGDIHIKKDILDQLAGGIHHVAFSAKEMEDIEKAGQQASNNLVAFDLKNSDNMKAALNKLANIPGFPGEIRQFKGETIYEIPLNKFTIRGQNMDALGEAKLGICVTKNCLMMSTSMENLEEIIRGNDDQQPLAESAKYKKVASGFPRSTSIIMYQDPETQLKPIWNALRQTQQEGIDFSKLPAFDLMVKYLKPSGAYVTPDKNGVMINNFQLK